MDLIKVAETMGVVGTGGTGLPTHAKLSAGTECFVMNGTECEPLIEADKYLIRTFPDRTIQAVGAVAARADTKRAVITLRKRYIKETTTLQRAIATSGTQVELFRISSFYLAGGEQVLIQQVYGASVPEHGVPLDMGAVVDNMGTLLNIHDALQGIPVTKKCLPTVSETERPVMRKVPLGMPLRECISNAYPHLQGYIVIVSGPMMERVVADPAKIDHLTVTKTTGNLIVLSSEHYLARWTALPLGRIKTQTKSACTQCRICTNLYPRYLIGHQIQPHLMMRNLFREELISDNDKHEEAFGQAVNCCDCGVYEIFSRPMGLSLHKVNAYLEDRLCEKGIQVPRNLSPEARKGSLYDKVLTDRLVARLGLSEYYRQHAGDDCTKLFPEQVQILFRQHIGKPAVPVAQAGETVQKGNLLASAAQGLSANIHTSINGVITEISEDGASIRCDREARGQ